MLALPKLALLLPLLLVAPSPREAPDVLPSSGATLGPPWISIEYPVNPYDASTRSAFLVVHAYHHGTPTAFPVRGTAEGMVNGARRSMALQFATTSRPGVFALNQQWPNEGTWTLLLSVVQGREDSVTAVVELGASGVVASVQVPTRQSGGHRIPAAVVMAAVETSLRDRAAQRSGSRPE